MVQRFHALDAVRGLALLLGVVLHATMLFFLPIPAQDSSRSAALALLFFVIHTFRMSRFFMVAGFFARMAFHRIGPRAFVKDRAWRIVAPMMVGWLLLGPPTLALVILGFTKSFPDGLPAGMDAATNSQEGFPLIHLWFLYYLCLLYGLALSTRAGFVAFVDPHGQVRARIDTVVRALLSNPLAPIVLGAPLCIALTSDPACPLWFGIPALDQGLLPQFKAIIGFGTAFGLGWVAGVEKIIGAFVAGLALNKLIPHSSALMNRIEFIGNALFIPFFLISVGMIVDVRVIMNGKMAIIVAATLTIVALLGKWVAAWITQMVFHYSAAQRQLIFGLSSSHAAATLAIILVGYNAHILDENILNGTLILILVTCVVASFATEKASKKIIISGEGDEKLKTGNNLSNEHILLPVANVDNIVGNLELALLIKDKKSPNPVSILSVVPNDHVAEINILKSKAKLGHGPT